MYDESPATRGMSASVLPPMWASINSSREKRRVLPLTTRCAAALNVSWGTCPRGGQDQLIFLEFDYRCDRESERRVRNRGRGRRLRAMDENDRTTCVECGPYGVVLVITNVLGFTSVPVRRRNGHTHRTKLVKNIGDEFKSP